MSDEEFKTEVQDLIKMIESLRLIKDRSRKRWLKAEIRAQLTKLMSD